MIQLHCNIESQKLMPLPLTLTELQEKLRLSPTLISFIKYTVIGVINTLIHWGIFGGCFMLLGMSQAFSNLLGFVVAVTFSFFANAKVTFKTSVSLKKYFLFTFFMGFMSYSFGKVADLTGLHPILTLVFFSLFSLVAGFIYSKFVVFK